MQEYLDYVNENQSYSLDEPWLSDGQIASVYEKDKDGGTHLKFDESFPGYKKSKLSLMPTSSEDQTTYSSRFADLYTQLAVGNATMAEAMETVIDFAEEMINFGMLDGFDTEGFSNRKQKAKIAKLSWDSWGETYNRHSPGQDVQEEKLSYNVWDRNLNSVGQDIQEMFSHHTHVVITTLCGARISISRLYRKELCIDSLEMPKIFMQEDLVVIEHDKFPPQIFEFCVIEGMLNGCKKILYHQGWCFKDAFVGDWKIEDLWSVKSRLKQAVKDYPNFQPLHAFGSIRKIYRSADILKKNKEELMKRHKEMDRLVRLGIDIGPGTRYSSFQMSHRGDGLISNNVSHYARYMSKMLEAFWKCPKDPWEPGERPTYRFWSMYFLLCGNNPPLQIKK